MARNRFFTVMIVPEKTSQVRKLVVPSWFLRGAAVGVALVSLIAIVMVLDYWYVMNQIGENKTLKLENRRLRQQVQVFRNKLQTIDSTMERVRTFATRLKVITNIQDRGELLQSLNSKLPDASANLGQSTAPLQAAAATSSTSALSAASTGAMGSSAAAPDAATTATTATGGPNPPTSSAVAPAAASGSGDLGSRDDPENQILRREYEQLDERFSELNRDTLYVEQMLQDQYELLVDQKAFLAALPTRRPAVGYFTSGFGIRKSPFGGRAKMHEGLDIANHPGTPIKSPADGVVTYAAVKAGYGETLIIDHGYGLETWYGHTRKILVTRGQRVRRGDQIALLGNSGRSTGPHVHYEVRVHGTPVDPLSYILEN